jgi:hypothetical protein
MKRKEIRDNLIFNELILNFQNKLDEMEEARILESISKLDTISLRNITRDMLSTITKKEFGHSGRS